MLTIEISYKIEFAEVSRDTIHGSMVLRRKACVISYTAIRPLCVYLKIEL